MNYPRRPFTDIPRHRLTSYPLSTFLVLALISQLLASCARDKSPISPSPTDDYSLDTIEFPVSEPFDKIEQLVAQYRLSVDEIRLDLPAMTVGYTVSGRDLSTIRDDLLAQHLQFLRLKLQEAADGPGDPNSVSSSLAQLEAALNKTESGTPLVSGLIIRNSLTAPIEPSLIGATLLGSANPKLSPSQTPDAADEQKSSSGVLWAPTSGWSKVNQCMTYQKFRFVRVTHFATETATYEHETQIYEPLFADYANYYATNMPCGYLDTRVSDDPNPENYAIGCARAKYLVANTTYWTYMALRAGSRSTGTTRIKGQLGFRWPSSCGCSTWCVRAIETSPSLAYLRIPTKPEGESWTYPPL